GADEPVLAGPPSAGYRLRKLLRRHRGPALAASLVLLALVAGIVGTTTGLVRAVRARQAEVERAEGEHRAREAAEQGIEILGSIVEKLDPLAEGKEGRPRPAILTEQLDQGAAALARQARGAPPARSQR